MNRRSVTSTVIAVRSQNSIKSIKLWVDRRHTVFRPQACCNLTPVQAGEIRRGNPTGGKLA